MLCFKPHGSRGQAPARLTPPPASPTSPCPVPLARQRHDTPRAHALWRRAVLQRLPRARKHSQPHHRQVPPIADRPLRPRRRPADRRLLSPRPDHGRHPAPAGRQPLRRPMRRMGQTTTASQPSKSPGSTRPRQHTNNPITGAELGDLRTGPHPPAANPGLTRTFVFGVLRAQGIRRALVDVTVCARRHEPNHRTGDRPTRCKSGNGTRNANCAAVGRRGQAPRGAVRVASRNGSRQAWSGRVIDLSGFSPQSARRLAVIVSGGSDRVWLEHFTGFRCRYFAAVRPR